MFNINNVELPHEPDEKPLQWVTFQLGDEMYGINVMQVCSVLRYTPVTPVPGAPDFVMGMINLRGNVVTVIDMRSRLGLLNQEITDNTRIVVVEVETQTIGMLVDSVAEVVDLYSSEIDKVPSLSINERDKFILGVCSRNDSLLILMDLNELLTKVEWTEVANL